MAGRPITRGMSYEKIFIGTRSEPYNNFLLVLTQYRQEM